MKPRAVHLMHPGNLSGSTLCGYDSQRTLRTEIPDEATCKFCLRDITRLSLTLDEWQRRRAAAVADRAARLAEEGRKAVKEIQAEQRRLVEAQVEAVQRARWWGWLKKMFPLDTEERRKIHKEICDEAFAESHERRMEAFTSSHDEAFESTIQRWRSKLGCEWTVN